jgi:hypothetical protein
MKRLRGIFVTEIGHEKGEMERTEESLPVSDRQSLRKLQEITGVGIPVARQGRKWPLTADRSLPLVATKAKLGSKAYSRPLVKG